MKNIKIIRITSFCIAIIAVMLGHGVVIPLITNYVEQGQPLIGGAILSVYSLGSLITSPIIGNYIEKNKSKKILQASLLLYFILLFFVFYISNILILLVTRFIMGALMSTIFAIIETYVSKYEPEDCQSRDFFLIATSNSIGMSLGPLIGFAIISYNIKFLGLFSLLLFALFTVILLQFIFHENQKLIINKNIHTNYNLNEEFKMLLLNHKAFYSIICYGVFGFIVSIFEAFALPFILLHYKNEFISTSKILLIFEIITLILFAIIYFIYINPIIIKKFTSFKLIIYTELIAIILFFITFSISNILIFILLLAILIIDLSIFSNAIIIYLSINYHNKGFILGLKNSSMQVGAIIGPLFAGGIATLSIERFTKILKNEIIKIPLINNNDNIMNYISNISITLPFISIGLVILIIYIWGLFLIKKNIKEKHA